MLCTKLYRAFLSLTFDIFLGVSNLGHPTQTRKMPAVGFFSQAIRSQTLQFQEGQITTEKVEKKDPPLMSSSLVSMSSTQSVNSAMYTIPGAQPQSTGMVPGMTPAQSRFQLPAFH